jgi:hypothetical protein
MAMGHDLILAGALAILVEAVVCENLNNNLTAGTRTDVDKSQSDTLGQSPLSVNHARLWNAT